MGRKTKPFSTKAQLRQLQAKWYARLRRDGFVDVEGGRDLNHLNATTLPGSGSLSFVSTTAEGPDGLFDATELFEVDNDAVYGGFTSVANTSQAVLWRKVMGAAHDLPSNYKHRAFLIDWATSGGKRRAAARRAGIPINIARGDTARFCARIGVEEIALFTSANPARSMKPEAPTPAPVRRLSKREIARLQYTPPTKKDPR
jgi:hypothetical protein